MFQVKFMFFPVSHLYMHDPPDKFPDKSEKSDMI